MKFRERLGSQMEIWEPEANGNLGTRREPEANDENEYET